MTQEDIQDLLKKSLTSLKASKTLTENGFYDFSASRSYYTMFYAAEAALLDKGLSFSKHSAVVAFFGKEFIKTGELPERLHRYLVDAFDIRNIGDYGAPGSISKEKSEELIENSEEFLNQIENYLHG